jgi:response regulator RpfG family c-di-GMP phosphodiesterase
MANERILLVDDDPYLLNAFRRQLKGRFDLETTESPENALQMIRESGPYAVIVSDMQMPEINGLELLRRCHQQSPRTVRIVLTGNADQQTAIDSINQGEIFRFLVKPCETEDLIATIGEAVKKYESEEAEAQLLAETLNGAMKLVTDVLSTVRPEAFGHSQAARKLARDLAKCLDVPDPWLVELAAMLSYIGSIGVPDEDFHRYLADEPMRTQQAIDVERFAQVGHDLVVNIPRLRPVAHMIGRQLDAVGSRAPVGSRILRVVNDYLRFKTSGDSYRAIDKLRSRPAIYDQQIVEHLIDILNQRKQIISVSIADLKVGQTLSAPIKTIDGVTLIGTDCEVSEVVIERLKKFTATGRVDDKVKVTITTEIEIETDATSMATGDDSTMFNHQT